MTEHDRWVQAHLFQMRAERTRRRTITTGTGRRNMVNPQDDRGERILYGPSGAKVRVIEWEGGNQIEQWDDRLHAIVRPNARFRLIAGSVTDA